MGGHCVNHSKAPVPGRLERARGSAQAAGTAVNDAAASVARDAKEALE